MTLRRIDAETLLTPPEPLKASVVMLGMSGYAVRISPKGGAQLVELLPDGASKRRQTFIRGAMPENTEQGNILWQCRSLHAAGTWRPEHPSLPLQHLHTERGLTTDWHCLQPRSRVSLHLENRHYEGIGYAERLHMTLPP